MLMGNLCKKKNLYQMREPINQDYPWKKWNQIGFTEEQSLQRCIL